ncbi:calcium-dependent lipid-binding protein-like [Nymphaea colorata]|nr:calcium-dependent lipid-binding protein-like [Nymphaea colorata]
MLFLEQSSSAWTSSHLLTASLPFAGVNRRGERKCRSRRSPTVAPLGLGRDFRCRCLNKSSPGLSYEFAERISDAQRYTIVKRLSDELELVSDFSSFREDPIVEKLRSQVGVIKPIPPPPVNGRVAGMFVFFFFVGVMFDKLLTSGKRNKWTRDSRSGIWPQVPTSFSLFLEKDLQRKESVEWVNMVLGKLWKVYRNGIENWIIGLLQPVIDDLNKPGYVQRVEIKQFSLGEEPLSVRNVERRTSRRANDLQYQIGLRYTGGARMLLLLTLKFGFIPVVVPVGIRHFDIDGELWVKLRLIPSEPWVGAVSWAFVSLPKIKFELAPFRLFNLMAIPVISMFLTKLLTEDLPRLFVRPKKIVLDFEKGETVGLFPEDFRAAEVHDGNSDFAGELSVTLVDAQKLAYVPIGKTDPYVVLTLGNQVICSKRNSQTTVIGPPGAPIWNQDFHMLVDDPRQQQLCIQVKDSFGFADYTIGTGEVELSHLQDTVPTDRIISLRGGWGVFSKGTSGEILLRLTYKAYVEDEEDDRMVVELDGDTTDDETSDEEAEGLYEPREKSSSAAVEEESFMNVLSALIVSEEFQGIVKSETGNSRPSEEAPKRDPDMERSSGLISPKVALSDPESNPNDSAGSVIFWLAVATSFAFLISFSVHGSNIFNP